MNNADHRTLLWFSFLTSLGLTPFLIAAYFREGDGLWLLGAICSVFTIVAAIYQLRNP